MMQEFSSFDGAILIDKPAGPTSHDVVDAIRRHFKIKKVGHCGTLDPAATGLLIIVLGRGTKLSEKLMADDKVYEGTIKFGGATDSYDADGELIASLPVPLLTVDQLNAAAAAFVGDQMQVPPMVSAVKKDGVPLYKLARKGVEVPREPRLIHIYDFRFSAYAEPIDIPALARIACVSEAHFIRTFRATFGETPHRYLQRRRVERSMFMLRETDRSVTEICLDVGFSSLGTFSRTFREIMGESPSAYRKGATVGEAPTCFIMAWTRPSSFGEAGDG